MTDKAVLVEPDIDRVWIEGQNIRTQALIQLVWEGESYYEQTAMTLESTIYLWVSTDQNRKRLPYDIDLSFPMGSPDVTVSICLDDVCLDQQQTANGKQICLLKDTPLLMKKPATSDTFFEITITMPFSNIDQVLPRQVLLRGKDLLLANHQCRCQEE